MSNNKTFSFFLCLLTIGFIVGCGPKLPDGMPKLYPVTITVTQDGTPMEGADVILSGVGDWMSTGTTDANGLAKLYTLGQYVGVPAGTHKVTVTKVVAEGEKPPPNPFDAESQRVFQEYQRAGKTYVQFHTTAREYRIPDTSPLSVEVKSGVKNVSVDVKGTIKEEIHQRITPR